MTLPPFLQPLPNKIHHSSPCISAQFVHGGELGSSHALWWPSKGNSTPDKVLLFIPGNPGLVDFYFQFLSALHEKHTASTLAILAHGFLDHFPGIENGPGRYLPEDSLVIQVQTSLEIVDSLVLCYPDSKLLVAGHSVGSWITVQMMKARPAHFKSCFLLFPTLSNIRSAPNGRVLFPLFYPTIRRILASLSFLVTSIPDVLFARLFSTWPRHQLLVLHGFLSSSSCILAALAMAHEEMKTIREPDTNFFQINQEILWFYFGKRDGWVGSENLRTLLGIIDPSKTSTQIFYGPPEVPHAFCISHSELLTPDSLAWLNSLSE